MPSVHHEVLIERPLPLVGRYLGSVPNLARWTTFFVAVGAQRDGRYDADSLAGPIVTWIETEPGSTAMRHTICSIIANRTERATLELEERQRGVSVRFRVDLPERADEAAVAHQHAAMRRELATLKDLVEGDHARS